MFPRAVLMKNGLRPLNTVRPVNTAHHKTTVYSARPISHSSKSAQSTIKRPYHIRTTLTNKNFNQKVNTVKGNFYTARPKAVNTAKPNSAVVNAGHPQKEDQGYVNSGCSRHMTGNMSYLSDFKEFNGGYVTFGGEANGGKITGKVTLKTADESQVLLKVPRKNNMYSVDMKNIVPKESLTCLAEAVNTACYVQNRVLVVKPHNKTPYELFRGRTPSLSFMKTFGCHVTILNILDHLGKFDGNSDEGFFVGYSLNSKAFKVYNIRTRNVEENLHIRFLEDKPIIVGDEPKWLFDINVLTKSINYVPVVAGTNSNDSVGTRESVGIGDSSKVIGSSQDYILMPLWKDGLLFDSSSKNASNDEPQPSSDDGKKDDEGVCQENELNDQEKPVSSAQDVNTAGPSINTTNPSTNTASPTGPTTLPETSHADFFRDETELDMSNISATYLVPSTPNTRIHKDHSLENVIGDVQSGVKT
ncbi:putative ribonuclease H-like domain-containing protein [Tanacetum coccineum]